MAKKTGVPHRRQQVSTLPCWYGDLILVNQGWIMAFTFIEKEAIPVTLTVLYFVTPLAALLPC